MPSAAVSPARISRRRLRMGAWLAGCRAPWPPTRAHHEPLLRGRRDRLWQRTRPGRGRPPWQECCLSIALLDTVAPDRWARS